MKSTIKIFWILLCVFCLIPTGMEAQKKKSKGGKSVSSAAVKPPKFNAFDPFDKANDHTIGMPWEQSEVTPLKHLQGVEAAIPAPLPHVSQMSQVSYNMAVSQAFESLRLVYGELTEKQAEELTEAWAPLYNYPSQRVIDYLNKLNPLLSQYLVARENWWQTAFCIDQLEIDLINAVDMDNEEGFKQIYFEYRLYVNAQKQYAEAMIELTNRIIELGNPPNPFDDMRRARARYNQMFPQKEKKKGEMGDCWIGTREVSNSAIAGLKPLTEPLLRYLFTAKTDQGEAYFAIELGEEGTTERPDTEADPASLYNIRVHQIAPKPVKGDKPSVTSDGKFQKYFPNPPKMMITSLTVNLMFSYETSSPTEQDKKTPNLYAAKLAHHNAAGNYVTRVGRSGFFFKAALKWSMARKWDKYIYKNGVIPQKALDDFAEAVREEIRAEMSWKALPKKERKELAAQGKDPTAMPTEADGGMDVVDQQALKDSLAAVLAARQHDIDVKKELIQSYQKDLSYYQQKLREAQNNLNNAAPGSLAYQNASTQVEFYTGEVIRYTSNIQAEQDNIYTLQTGEFRHTRTLFDQVAHDQMVRKIEEEAAKYSYCKKMEAGIERQINLLPVEERAKARETAEKLILTEGALAKGDYKKMQRLRNALNSKIVGYAMRDQAEAEIQIVNSQEKEFAVNCGLMIGGALVAGIAPQAFATPLMTVGNFLRTGGTAVKYASAISRVTGMVYTGVTGFAAAGGVHATADYLGGKENVDFSRPIRKAVISGLGGFNIATTGAATFVDEFTEEENQGLPPEDRAWMAAKKATANMLFQYCLQKGIEKTVQLTSSRGNVKVGENKLSAKQQRDLLITKKEQLEAKDAIASFKELEAARTKADWANNKAEVARLDKELDQLVASMNSSYQAKHQLKYSTASDAAVTRTRFDQRVQNIYKREIPEMNKILEQKGWKMDDIEWKQFRNSSSVGSSSMDLDLGVVSRKNNYVEPNYVKNGDNTVTAQDFLRDAQEALNTIHKQNFGISAGASEMNITNSAHPEAFATAEVLSPNYNWNAAPPQTLKSINKVLDVKTNAINNNVRLTETSKLQANCREYSKEMENMLLPKLKQNLQTLKPGSEKYKQVQENIATMTEMTKKFKQIGSHTGDPSEILAIERQIYMDTGGKSVSEVMNDVKNGFELSIP